MDLTGNCSFDGDEHLVYYEKPPYYTDLRTKNLRHRPQETDKPPHVYKEIKKETKENLFYCPFIRKRSKGLVKLINNL